MSLFTHSIHVFLGLPFPAPPTTTKFLHLETQSSTSLRSTSPNHLSLPCLTTPSTPTTPSHSTPELLTRSSVLQSHSRHPPNHAIFRSLKPLHIIHYHRPSFTTIHKHPLYTHSIYLSLHSQ